MAALQATTRRSFKAKEGESNTFSAHVFLSLLFESRGYLWQSYLTVDAKAHEKCSRHEPLPCGRSISLRISGSEPGSSGTTARCCAQSKSGHVMHMPRAPGIPGLTPGKKAEETGKNAPLAR